MAETDWIKKKDPTLCSLLEIHFIMKKNRLKMKDKVHQVNANKKGDEMAI